MATIEGGMPAPSRFQQVQTIGASSALLDMAPRKYLRVHAPHKPIITIE
jgi:hypothetical protein